MARRRERTDLYAQILEVVKRYHGQGRVTRISYAVGMPVDRLNDSLERLRALDLIRKQTLGGFVAYELTVRGQEFLDTYWKMRAFTALLGEATGPARD